MLRHVQVLIIDGHPGRERLTTALLDAYRAALPPTATVTTIAVRDLTFDPTLHAGYGAEQPWEPDVARVARELDACDHVCFGFPLWWGAEPAPLLALLERVLMPGFAFRYRTTSVFWEKRLRGRSADLIVTMDSPPLFLRLVYGDPIGRRWACAGARFCRHRPDSHPALRTDATRRCQAKCDGVVRARRSNGAIDPRDSWQNEESCPRRPRCLRRSGRRTTIVIPIAKKR